VAVGIGVDEQDLFARWWEFQQRARGTRTVWLERGDISPATEQRLARWIRFDS
jgi:hypothetical protein